MHTLKFRNPKFRAGLNVTVRNGSKWADRVQAGDIVELGAVIDDPDAATCEGHANMVEKIGHAEIFHTAVAGYVDTIPAVWLQYHHGRTCATKLGLIKALDAVYPKGWGGDDGLTVVMFNVLK